MKKEHISIEEPFIPAGVTLTAITVTRVFLLLAPERVIPMLEALQAHLGRPCDAVAASTRPAVELIELLRQEGWMAERHPDGSVLISGCRRAMADLKRDPVLESAVCCVSAGSSLQGFAADNLQWQIRYYEAGRRFAVGTVCFPPEPEWDQLFRSLLIIREAQAGDRELLAALSPLPIDLGAGPILLAERADRVVAFVQYRPHAARPQASTITRLATQVRGRNYGYPHALIAELQRRFTRLEVSLHLNVDHKRTWKEMGFRPVLESGEAHPQGNAWNLWEANHTATMDAAALRQRLHADLRATLCERHSAEQEYQAMRLRFGLDDGRCRTIEETARQIGGTRDRIRKTLAYALTHLRSEEGVLQDLADYLLLISAPHRVTASIDWLLPVRGKAGDHCDAQ